MNLKFIRTTSYILVLLLVSQHINPLFAKQTRKPRVGIVYVDPRTVHSPFSTTLENSLAEQSQIIPQSDMQRALTELASQQTKPELSTIVKFAMDDYYHGATRTQSQSDLEARFNKLKLVKNSCLSGEPNSILYWSTVATNMAQIHMGQRQYNKAMEDLKLAYKLNPNLQLDEAIYPESITRLFATIIKKYKPLANTQPVTAVDITSIPEKASVYLNGIYAGKSPLKLKLKSTAPALVTLTKESHEASCVVINAGPANNSLIALNLNPVVPQSNQNKDLNLATLSQNNILVSGLAKTLKADQLLFVYTNQYSRRSNPQVTSYQVYNRKNYFMSSAYVLPRAHDDIFLAEEITQKMMPESKPTLLAETKNPDSTDITFEDKPESKTISNTDSNKKVLWIVGGILLLGAAAGAGIGLGMGGSSNSNTTAGTASVDVSAVAPQ